MLLGEKNAELGPGRSKYKARGVALGNMVRDAAGKLVSDPATLYVTPMGLEANRLLDAYGALAGTVQTADVRGAYLQAALGGPPMFLEVPPEFLPDSVNQMGLRKPTFRLHRAIYGLERSGGDWNKDYTQKCKDKGWQVMTDIDRSVFSISSTSMAR